MADYRVTPDFINVYQSLRGDAVAAVDDVVVRLLTEHTTLWARRGRVVGTSGSAWVVEFGTSDMDLTLYWDYLDDQLLLLVLLLKRRVADS